MSLTRAPAAPAAPSALAATVVLRELIAPYPDLPVAVGVIGADVDERFDAAGRLPEDPFARHRLRGARRAGAGRGDSAPAGGRSNG